MNGHESHAHRLVLRPLQAADEDLLRAFFRSHTEETVYFRYGYHLSDLTPERARELVNVDQDRNVAWAIFGTNGAPLIHAVARYYTESADTAEMAIVVRESMRRRGFATLLLRQLARVAEQRGLAYLRAQVMSGNTAMRRFVARYSPEAAPASDGDATDFRIPIARILTPFARFQLRRWGSALSGGAADPSAEGTGESRGAD